MLSKSQLAPIVTMLHFEPSVFLKGHGLEFCRNSVSSGKLLTVLLPSFKESAQNIFPDVQVVAMPNAIENYKCLAKLEQKKIVCIARLALQKRVDLLIESFSLIKDKYPDWVVEFWGEKDVEPRYRDKIFHLCEQLNVQNRVLFKGKTSNVEAVLSDSSIFAFPSLFEGFPLALGEAMSKGVPSVGCIDCPGVNDLIRNERNGLLVEPSPEVFANALSRLIDDKDLRRKLGVQAKVDISEYCPEKVWSKWDDLIKRLTS